MLADARDVVEAMGARTGQRFAWEDGKTAPHADASAAAVGVLTLPHRVYSRFLPRSTASRDGGGGSGVNRGFAFFISYFREEAGCDCRLLQQRLGAATGRPIFLDTTSADSISDILDDGLRNSEALLLVQTANVLYRPWVLLEIFCALLLRIPVIPVCIEGGGYDFQRAKTFLASDDLGAALDAANPGASAAITAELAKRGHTIAELQRVLAKTVPNVISVFLAPAGTENHLNAVMQDLMDKKERALEGLRRRADSTSTMRWRGLVPANSRSSAAAATSAKWERSAEEVSSTSDAATEEAREAV